MESSDQMKIRWNNHTSALEYMTRKLLESGQFSDVTLACEGQSIKCHRMILSACSTTLKRILSDNSAPNLVILLTDMKYWELRALVAFMYNGEVNICREQLPGLCKAAIALKVKGLGEDGYEVYEDFHEDGQEKEDVTTPVQLQLQSLLLQLQNNNLATFGAATRLPKPKLMKRKNPQPPKLVKIRKVDGPTCGSGRDLVQRPHLSSPSTKMSELEREVIRAGITENEVDQNAPYESESPDADAAGNLEANAEIHGCEDGMNSDSELDSQQKVQQTGRPQEIKLKNRKQVRDSAPTAMHSGMDLGQYPEAYKISRKSLPKWKSRETRNNSGEKDWTFYAEDDGSRTPTCATRGIIVPPKAMGAPAPMDSADRAERLKKASELALSGSGFSVQKAAKHFGVARSTLCAYMKRRGLVAKPKNFFANNTGVENKAEKCVTIGNDCEVGGREHPQEQGGTLCLENGDSPVFMCTSELKDEMSEGEGNCEEEPEGRVDGDEEY